MIEKPSAHYHNNCYICGSNKYNKYDYCLNCWRKIEAEIKNIRFFEYTENELTDYIDEIESKFESDFNELQAEALENYAKSNLISLIAYYDVLAEEYDYEINQSKINEYQTKTAQFINDLKLGNIEITEKFDNENDELKDFRKKYPAEFHCEDGHYVRSPYEQQIDDYLNERHIRHYYEKRYKNFETGECYYPDWFLPDLTKKGVYIECFGKQDTYYKTKTDEKLKFYKKEKINLIEIYPENIQNLKEYLDDEINKYL